MESELHNIVRQARNIESSTRDKYLRDLDQWITFAGADPLNWTRKKASEFYNGLLTRMRPQSARRLMASLAYASKWWAHFENRPDLDFAKVQIDKGSADKRPQNALDQHTATALLNACGSSSLIDLRDFALLVVGLETGMRRMSLAGMQVETTRLVAGIQPKQYPATLVPLKGKEPKWVPLSDTAVAALAPWLFALRDHGIYSGPVFAPLCRKVGLDGKTAWAPKPESLSRTAMSDVFSDRAKQAKIPHLNPHLMRHTFVTWRIAVLEPHEIASITHHDIRGIGALAGYIDLEEIGGRVRNQTPTWLAELVQARSERIVGSVSSP